MSHVTPIEVEALGRNWPVQQIPRYNEMFGIWRSQFNGQLAIGSQEDYTRMGAHWCQFANGKDLNPRLMLDWHMWVMDIVHPFSDTKKISAARVNRHHSVVRKFLAWLKIMGVITHDPSLALPNLRTPAPPPRKMWDHEEYTRIVRYGSRLPHRHCQTWLTILGYHTGMSLIDCAHLTWEEVVLKDDGPSYIQKPRAKLRTRLGRKAIFMVPILAGSEVWRWIKRLEARQPRNYKRADGINYVHQDAPNYYECRNPTMSERMRSFFAEELTYPGLKNRSFRHLRNSFCSRMINSGTDSVLVAQMTGHTRLEQLADYALPDIRALQDAMIRAMRWVEKDSGADVKPRFLTLPSSSGDYSTGEGGPTSPTSSSLVSVALGEAAINQKVMDDRHRTCTS